MYRRGAKASQLLTRETTKPSRGTDATLRLPPQTAAFSKTARALLRTPESVLYQRQKGDRPRLTEAVASR